MTKLRFLYEKLVGWLTHDEARVKFAQKIEQNGDELTVIAGSMEWLRAAQLVAATLGLSTSLYATEGRLRVRGDQLKLLRFTRILVDPTRVKA